jgi:Holliday junction resolvase RusA-like endonuclease
MTDLDFQVFGVPAPQGSKRAIPLRGGRVNLVESSAKVGPWRESVLHAARNAMTEYQITEPMQGPLWIGITFWLPRPKARSKTVDVWPAVKPDADKLIRSTFDAIKDSGLILDDAQFVKMIQIVKRYAVGPDVPKVYRPLFHQPPGAEITMGPLREP